MRGDAAASGPARQSVPWLTYALAALCVGGFLLAEKAALEVDAANGVALTEAEEFLADHPYLDVPPLLDRQLSEDTRALLGDESLGGHRSLPVLSRLLEREQAELDALVVDAEARAAGLPAQRYGLRAIGPWTAANLLHPLIHQGWLHLIGNLALLLLLGFYLESGFSRVVLAGVAAAGVAGSALGYVVGNPGFAEPLVGTTGLLAGLAGAHAVRFRGADEATPQLSVPGFAVAVLAIPVLLGLEWSVARTPGASPAVVGAFNPSLWAVLGGALAGAAAALGAGLIGLERVDPDAPVSAVARSSMLDSQFQRAIDLRHSGQLDEAFNLLIGVLRRFPDDVEASVALWHVASELGRPRAASAAIVRVVRDDIERDDIQGAVRHWLEMVDCDLDLNADPPLLLRMAPVLRENGAPEAAVRALRAVLGAEIDGKMAARVAQEAADLDQATARDAAWRALGSPELGLEERQELESLISVLQPHVFDDADDGPGEALDASDVVSGDDLLQPDEAEAALDAQVAAEQRVVEPIELDDASRNLECIHGVPTGLDVHGIVIELEGGLKKRLPYPRIEAIGVAAVDGVGDKTVLVVDLVLNWVSLTAEPLRLIRLRTDRFDPRQLVPSAADGLQALRAILNRLLEQTDAIALPDQQSVQGKPFAAFRSVEDYQSLVLMVGARDAD